jgi:hypothetical protein
VLDRLPHLPLRLEGLRLPGYGLKYPAAFKDTHLSHV